MNPLFQTALGLVACSLLLTAPASAQLKGNPENWCRNGHFPRESKDYRLAKIKGAAGDKIYFHDDSKANVSRRPKLPPEDLRHSQ